MNFYLIKKLFQKYQEDFLNFIKNKKIIIHNAAFDLSFLNYELRLINKKTIDKQNVIDTLEIARAKISRISKLTRCAL